MPLRKLFYDGVDVILHDLKFIFFCVAYNLLHNVLHSIYEILKSHLILICFCPHYFNKDKVVVLLGYFCTSHACKIGKFSELRWGEDPLWSDATLRVKYS